MGESKMKVEYDRKADILYIKLKETKIIDTRMLGEDLYVDVDKDNNFVGIEIWQASKNAIQPLSQTLAQEVKATLQKAAWSSAVLQNNRLYKGIVIKIQTIPYWPLRLEFMVCIAYALDVWLGCKLAKEGLSDYR